MNEENREAEPLQKACQEETANQTEDKNVLEPKCVQVLHDINLSVKPGELLGVAGAIGSGKSSLISSILGEVRIMVICFKNETDF